MLPLQILKSYYLTNILSSRLRTKPDLNCLNIQGLTQSHRKGGFSERCFYRITKTLTVGMFCASDDAWALTETEKIGNGYSNNINLLTSKIEILWSKLYKARFKLMN